MTLIRQEDFISSIHNALQYISCYHAPDFLNALHQAWQHEAAPGARDAIGQILINSYLCAHGHRPICQDTGIVVSFIKVGMDVRWETDLSLQQLVDERSEERRVGKACVNTCRSRWSPER